MRKNPDFELIKIEDSTYLLPCGQAICDHKRGIRINETGALIWTLADSSRNMDELIKKCLSEMELSDEESKQAGKDIAEFANVLFRAGILVENTEGLKDPEADIYDPEKNDASGRNLSATDQAAFFPDKQKCLFDTPLHLSIAGLRVDFYCDQEYTDPKLKDFALDDNSVRDSEPDQTVRVTYSVPSEKCTGTPFIHSNEMEFYRSGNETIISYNDDLPIKEIHLSGDGSCVTVYASESPDLTFYLFHAIRLPFLYLAEKKEKYAIHSASVLYKDRAWLFSAPSGTGKSTHAALWHEFLGTPYINGDLNLIGIENGEPVVYGIPWCGTSELFDTQKHILGGVIFLKRADNDRVEALDIPSGLVSLTRRTISPVWCGEALKNMISDLLPLARKIRLARLYCTKEPSAQKTLQSFIDAE